MSYQQNDMASRSLAQANLPVLANVVELTKQVINEVAGDDMPALGGTPSENAPYLSDLIIAKVSAKLAQIKGA
jgi:hypothetical protein